VDLDEYQQRAQETDRIPSGSTSDHQVELMVPLLGLAGEAGGLLTEFKKHLRDGEAHILFPERVQEELGDILWYVANIATKFGLSMSKVASTNLGKTADRWSSRQSLPLLFDDTAFETERFPRRFTIELAEVHSNGKTKIRCSMNGSPIGDDLTDNAYDDDGYRFHDVFHLAYVAYLGWSPVIRKLMGRKRRSDPLKDEVEDGGRAQVVDEAVSALVFEYARNHKWLEGINHLDYDLLKTVKGLTAHLEVDLRTMKDWQDAILNGFKVWRQVRANNGGAIHIDQDARSISYAAASTRQTQPEFQ
jgi:NTP pyrophosphatase (non-canonical NTP hydrolase)